MKNSSRTSSPVSPLVHLGIALALLLAACVAYGISYAMVSAESVQSNLLQSQIVTQNDAAAELVQAKTQIAQLSSQQGTVDQYFVSTTNIVPFLEQLQSIGKYLGADVQVASVSANPGTPYGTIAVSLTIDGSFDAVARTVGAIEYQPYNVSLTSLTLGTAPGSGSSGTASSSPQWTAAAAFTVGAETGAPTASSAVPATTNPTFSPAVVTPIAQAPTSTPLAAPQPAP